MQVTWEQVTADYQVGPIRSPEILKSVTATVKEGAFTAVVGQTGSGKSSLLKSTNGLLLPIHGRVGIGDLELTPENNKKLLKAVRRKVGMVFQFPESQLFAETVEKDIMFAPMNFGSTEAEARRNAQEIIQRLQLDASVLQKSPFSLSGGQKRYVAIAGILAMDPVILVLDEPGAGLDPKGKREMMKLIHNWHTERGLTTLFVTHDMDDVALYADQVIVMEAGGVVYHGTPAELFTDAVQLREWELELPKARRLQLKIEQASDIKLSRTCLTLDELTDALIEAGLA
ncbi:MULTISPECIES: energy-coupling factor transporter ATPase [Gracilibacillus]|uniref:energy-coupling factor transporter ATPase n=1 Tax=Gracilibacillus TaxID=74385 RepID=UPI000825BF27|nr:MULTISPECIES: energy-coupling factor transporter ATPase [Gracilibacillus]